MQSSDLISKMTMDKALDDWRFKLVYRVIEDKDVGFQKQKLLNLNPVERIWQHHFDEVTELPEDSQIIATNSHSRIQAYINYEKHLLGTQFHPEINVRQGNNYFLKDRRLLEANGYDVDAMVKQMPSFNTPKVFFEFFLNFGSIAIG